MFQSPARLLYRATTAPPSSRSTALTGIVPQLVRLTTRLAARLNGRLAGRLTLRGAPGCKLGLLSATV